MARKATADDEAKEPHSSLKTARFDLFNDPVLEDERNRKWQAVIQAADEDPDLPKGLRNAIEWEVANHPVLREADDGRMFKDAGAALYDAESGRVYDISVTLGQDGVEVNPAPIPGSYE